MRAKKIYETLDFNRSGNIKRSLNLGMEKELEPFSLKNAEDFFSMPIVHIEKGLNEDKDHIYLLGAIVSNEESAGIPELKNILPPKYFTEDIFLQGDKDEIIDTSIGKIYIEKVGSDEGIYFWAEAPAAIKFKLWEYPVDWDSWF